MGIVFFCQSCGARFEVDARMAGKKGRCKKCGQYDDGAQGRAPRVDESMPALAMAGAGGAAAAVAVPRAASLGMAGPGAGRRAKLDGRLARKRA